MIKTLDLFNPPMPEERVTSEGRFCRHHPHEKIQLRAYPCTLCYAAARDGAVVAQDVAPTDTP